MKPIWFDKAEVEAMASACRGTMIEHLGIELLEVGDDHIRGRMPVDPRTRQPAGVLHGGASVAFAESLASWAASHCVEPVSNCTDGLTMLAEGRDGHGIHVLEPGQQLSGTVTLTPHPPR